MGAILGTAGHVDHGKTELVKALTGVDTDRWEEEKRRGLTIDLGFAPLDLPKSGRVGLIDVPGHKDFLRNMLAGIGGVDVALMVVAADEGVMPQTREHFEIVRLFGTNRMVVAVTKSDLVDAEMIELVMLDVHGMLEGTRFEDSPVIQVSSVQRTGIDELVGEIDSAVSELEEKDFTKPARLPVDRVFVLKGIGTVVTGTLLSGRLVQGAELVIYPQLKNTRARQIHVHNEKRDEALAGNRVALNLTGVGKNDLDRGDVICSPDYLEPTVMLDARLELLQGIPSLKDWTRVKLYMGSAEVLARTAILGKKEIAPGESGYVQLRLERKSVAKFGDEFVVRSYSPMRVLGGGVILDANPRKHKRSDHIVLNILDARSRGKPTDIIAANLDTGLVDLTNLARSIDAGADVVEEAAKTIIGEGKARMLGSLLFDGRYLEALKERISSILKDYHEANPLQKGMSKEELRVRVKMAPQTFDIFLATGPDFEVVGDRVKLAEMKLELSEEQIKEREQIEKLFLESGFSPPSSSEVAARYSNQLFYSLIDSGRLVKITRDLVVHRNVLEDGKERIAGAAREKGPLKLTQIKEILRTTRKYAVPIAEYLDRTGFTRREGDLRTVN
jgi:selenocysteine-specific elongation factor